MSIKLLNIYIVSLLIFLSSSHGSAQVSNDQDSSALMSQVNILLNTAAALSKTDLDSAALQMKSALPLSLKAKNWDYYIAIISGLSANRYYRDDFESYKFYAQKALNEADRLLGKNNLRYGEALNNLAFLYQKRGDYNQGIKLLNQALEINQKNKIQQTEFAAIYQNLAINHRKKGDFPKALEYRKQALNINLNLTSPNTLRIGISYKEIGLVYKEMIELDSALFYLNKGLSILNKINASENNLAERNIITALHGIAEIWLLKEKPTNANKYIQRAIKLQKEDKAYRKAFSFELLAKKYILEKNYDKALNSIKEANYLSNTNYKESSYPIIARKLLITSKILHLQNALDEAIGYSQKALSVLAPDYKFNKQLDNPSTNHLLAKSDALNILFTKANYLTEAYEIKKDTSYLVLAYDTFLTAVELIRKIRHEDLGKYAKNQLAEKAIAIYEGAIKSSLKLFKFTNDEKYNKKAFQLAENNKALLLLETINEQFAQGNSRLPDSLLQKEKQLRIDLAFYQKKILIEKQKEEKTDQSRLKKWQDNVFNFQQEHDLLISDFEENYPSYYNLKYNNKPASVQKLRERLIKDNTAMIEYFVGEEKIYLFCLTSNDLNILELEIKDLPDQIQKLRYLVSNQPNDGMSIVDIQELWNSAYVCYYQLLKPAIDELPSDIDELFIIPDGILAYVPFDVLLTKPFEEDNKSLPYVSDYLISKYSISYDYSATLLVKNSERESSNYKSDFVAYAPAFQGKIAMLRDCDGDQLSQLKCNQNEVENIGSILNGKINSGQDASSINFINSDNQNRIIHLATHACVNEENPMLNKIFFSDNSLTLFDFYNTKLNTELVVLSACNTGFGKIQKGEGVMSIAKGFMAAGSPSTMLSLWSVDDCSTSDLMGYYYKNLKAGDKKNKALQNAKLKYLETAPKAQKHPFYWGAFVQFGNIEPVEFSGGMGWKYYWIGLGLGLILLLYYLLIYRKQKFG